MILEKFNLSGKVAMVTGASRGIGQAMAVGLAEAGADVVGVSRGSCDETQTQIETLGQRFLHLPCDLSQVSVAELNDMVAKAVEKLGGLDILVNAAGTTSRHPITEFPEEAWDVVIQVNLKSLMFLSQAAVRHFVKAGGGKIVNVASALSFQGGILCPSYTASKHAVVGVTKAMANELAGQHINVNAIAPGYILTDLTQPIAEDPVRNPSILARIPAQRWGLPEDLKGACVFLASDAADYCHATTLIVDGAWLSR